MQQYTQHSTALGWLTMIDDHHNTVSVAMFLLTKNEISINEKSQSFHNL